MKEKMMETEQCVWRFEDGLFDGRQVVAKDGWPVPEQVVVFEAEPGEIGAIPVSEFFGPDDFSAVPCMVYRRDETRMSKAEKLLLPNMIRGCVFLPVEDAS